MFSIGMKGIPSRPPAKRAFNSSLKSFAAFGPVLSPTKDFSCGNSELISCIEKSVNDSYVEFRLARFWRTSETKFDFV